MGVLQGANLVEMSLLLLDAYLISWLEGKKKVLKSLCYIYNIFHIHDNTFRI